MAEESTARCCCECEACRIFFDNFNREDITGTGTGAGIGEAWDEILGIWVVENNVLKVTTDNSVAAVIDPTHETPYVWSVKFRGYDYSDEIRVGMGIQGGTYVYAQIRLQSAPGLCGELALYKSDGTLLTNVGVPALTPMDWHTIRVCLKFDDDEYGEYGEPFGDFAALVTTKTLVRRRVAYTDLDPIYNNPQVGLGTGNITTAVEFDDACWQRHKTTEDTVEIIGGTGTGTGSGTGTFTTPADPTCPDCQYRDGCNWGSLYTEVPEPTGTGTPPGPQPIACDWQEDFATGTGTGTGSGTSVAEGWLGYEHEAYATNSDSILKFSTIAPAGETRHRVTAAISATTEGTKALLYLNYVSPSVNMAARLTFSDTCGMIEIIRNGAVLDWLKVEPLVVGSTHFLCVSYDGDFLKADVAPLADREHLVASLSYRHLSEEVPVNDDGGYVAIGVEDNTGTVTFRNVTASFPYHAVDYPQCNTCDNCQLSKPPSSADLSSLCEWEPISGTVSQLGTSITISSLNGYAGYRANDKSSNVFVEASLIGTVSGQILRIYANSNEALNGPWAEVDFKSAPQDTFLRLSTGEQALYPMRPGEPHSLSICLSSTSITANIDASGGSAPTVGASVSGTLALPVVGKYAVFQLRGAAGTASFTGITLDRLVSPRPINSVELVQCHRCYTYCNCCIDGTAPEEFVVEIEGLTSGCCVNYNGAYHVRRLSECVYIWNPPGVYDTCNRPNSVRLHLVDPGTPGCKFEVQVNYGDGVGGVYSIIYRTNPYNQPANSLDCLNVVRLPFPLHLHSVGGSFPCPSVTGSAAYLSVA